MTTLNLGRLRAALRSMLFWSLFPLVIPQAIRARRSAPRLAGAGGPTCGAAGSGQTFKLLAIGDSIIAGVGVETLAGALPGQVATELAPLLAGVSLFSRWNEDDKRLLVDSRVSTTRNVVDAIPSDAAGKMTLLNASGAGYYGLTQDEELDETSPAGSDFLARLAESWEDEAIKAERNAARVIRARIGIVLGQDDGALSQMVLPFRFFAGGHLGDGRQWISWIHMRDVCRAALFAIENKATSGPLNFTAPTPVRNVDRLQLHVWYGRRGLERSA